mgnify:CR=1 FL=1
MINLEYLHTFTALTIKFFIESSLVMLCFAVV